MATDTGAKLAGHIVELNDVLAKVQQTVRQAHLNMPGPKTSGREEAFHEYQQVRALRDQLEELLHKFV